MTEPVTKNDTKPPMWRCPLCGATMELRLTILGCAWRCPACTVLAVKMGLTPGILEERKPLAGAEEYGRGSDGYEHTGADMRAWEQMGEHRGKN